MAGLNDKIQSLISGLKEKLPFGKDEDDEEDEDEEVEADEEEEDADSAEGEEEDDEEDGVESDKTDEIDTSIMKKAAANADDEDEDEEEEDDDEDEDDGKAKGKKPLDDAAKKKQLLIRGGIGLVILYLALDMFVLNPEGQQQAESTPAPAPQKKTRRAKKDAPDGKKETLQERRARKKREREAKQNAEGGASDVASVPEESTPAPVEKEEPAAAPEPAPAPEPVAESAPEPEPVAESVPAPEPKEEAVPKSEMDIPPETSGSVAVANDPLKEMTESAELDEDEASPLDKALESTSESKPMGESSEGSLTMDKAVDKLIDEADGDQSLADSTQNILAEKIAGDKQEYIAPPKYSRIGRGLVYNCNGKHWACVDKFSYFKCRENNVWARQNQKNPECAIKNVYATTEDCRLVQIHYINTSEPTEFCGAKMPANAQVAPEMSAPEVKPMEKAENQSEASAAPEGQSPAASQ